MTTIPSIPSPCIGICRLDQATGYCLGCGRTADELAEWSSATDARRSAIWSKLPLRFAALGLVVTRLPWSHERIVAFVADSLLQRSGTCVLGCYGATAEFVVDDDEVCDVSVDGNVVSAISEKGALRLTMGEHVRALALRDDRAREGYRAVFLVVLKSREMLPVAAALTPLGLDEDAIRSSRRRDLWFDLGLGRAEMRFCVRTSEAGLLDVLNGAVGLPLTALLSTWGAVILSRSPDRVIETPLGRAEIGTSIPHPGGRSPAGPHTHLLPDYLLTVRATEPGIELPPVYALGATFHPRAAVADGGATECSGS
jgi:predicted Fe-S protein YdhL (DUF1289 family)